MERYVVGEFNIGLNLAIGREMKVGDRTVFRLNKLITIQGSQIYGIFLAVVLISSNTVPIQHGLLFIIRKLMAEIVG